MLNICWEKEGLDDASRSLSARKQILEAKSLTLNLNLVGFEKLYLIISHHE